MRIVCQELIHPRITWLQSVLCALFKSIKLLTKHFNTNYFIKFQLTRNLKDKDFNLKPSSKSHQKALYQHDLDVSVASQLIVEPVRFENK